MTGGLSGDEKLPQGTLSRSRDSIELQLLGQKKRLSFEQAQKFDAINEAMPPGKVNDPKDRVKEIIDVDSDSSSSSSSSEKNQEVTGELKNK